MKPRLLLLAAIPAFAFAGCAKVVDDKHVEDQISKSITPQLGEKPKVDCPSGKDAKKGTSFTCTASLRGQKVNVIVKMTTDKSFTYSLGTTVK